jgi:hypothetical protein
VGAIQARGLDRLAKGALGVVTNETHDRQLVGSSTVSSALRSPHAVTPETRVTEWSANEENDDVTLIQPFDGRRRGLR